MTSLTGFKPTGGQLRGTTTPGPRGAGPGDVIPKGYRKGSLQQFGPEQMQQFQQLFSLIGQDSDLWKMAMGEEGAFEESEAPAHRQFNALMGNIGSRFGGMGGALSSKRSSGFQNTTTSAASNFAQDLQAKRQELQRQATMDLSNISSMLLGQKPQENILTPKSSRRSFMDELFMSTVPAFAEGVGKSLPGAFGGGGGA